jgi:hypothetical protein
MSLLGRAIGRLARSTGGQIMLELPDDLDPGFVGDVLHGANDEVQGMPPFALYVRGQRQDAVSIEPQVDFRELAMYRQGAHLAIAFASDNRGMATYASVYPLLLSNGFPSASTVSGGTGVAGLPEFSACLAEVLVEHQCSQGLSSSDFMAVTDNILEFLASAYEVAGNGQSSFAADWWLHVCPWINSLEHAASNGSSLAGIQRLYGCAGLPFPASGLKLKLTAKEYVRVLRDRWAGSQAIAAEINRLSSIPEAEKAAVALGRIDWEESFSKTSLRTDSIVALVAGDTTSELANRIDGWGNLCETEFEGTFVDAKGKLRLLRDGNDLPSPWKNAPAVLVAAETECQGDEFLLAGIELVIPAGKRVSVLGSDVIDEMLSPSIEVRGARGCNVSFNVDSEQLLADGLHLAGTLRFVPSKKSKNLAWIEAVIGGTAAHYLVDRCDISFVILRADEAALWARPRGGTKKGSLRGPIVWLGSDPEARSIEVPEPGAYELAVAWGESTGIDMSSLLAKTVAFDSTWLAMDDCGAKVMVDVTDPLDITSGSRTIFQIDLSSNEERPLSPITAAASGLTPNTSTLVAEGTLGYLEAKLGDCLAAATKDDLLGCVFATSTRHKQDLIQLSKGALCTPDLSHRTGNELSPGFPSHQLASHPAYAALREAYLALDLPATIAKIEAEEAVSGLTASRIQLDFIPQESIKDLLAAYRELVLATSEMPAADAFWARHPFTVVVYPDGAGYQSAAAVLLSPLHPIRLAWMWSLHVGLREAYDDGANPAESLSLVDGTHFPSFVAFKDQFETHCALMPVQIDARPSDIYTGWHASVAISHSKQPIFPEWIAGRAFPVDGLSALSSAAVGAAIDDFLRVSPHVQSLHIELANVHASRRSSAMDDGVISKIGELAVGSLGLDGVAGIRVTDSDARLGSAPSFAGISDAFAVARPGFNTEWVSVPSNRPSSSHLTFLEGNAALLSVEPSTKQGDGWLPNLPLRRTPSRSSGGNFTAVQYTLAPQLEDAPELAKVLHTYESQVNTPHAIKMIPNPTGVAGRPGWLVAGDFGVDPRGISRAARDQSSSSYILWDWRPATTIKPARGTSCRAQPYFILASVPPALNNALRERLGQLSGEMPADEVERRTRLLVSTLAERAIGLNTLLSIGHHQATGALGFYFALQSIGTWLARSPEGEVRMVVPIDAVDPFLRASNKGAGDGSRKRADLLVVRAFLGGTNGPRVVLVPVEIKHYGLGNNGKDVKFPLAGDSKLHEHADQLRSYQNQLEAFCEAYRIAIGSHASLLGQRLAAVLDAALQLGSGNGGNAASLLAAVASGRANIELGKGVLFWYQAGASGIDGSKASWDETPGVYLRNDIRVDPAAFDGCFWKSEEGNAHEVVREALEDASHQPAPYTTEIIDEEHVDLVLGNEGKSHSPDTCVAPPVTKLQETQLKENVPVPLVASDISTPLSAGSPIVRKKLSMQSLERRYAALLAALGEFNVKVERPRGETPYREGPAFIEFSVFPSYGVSVSRIESQLQNLKLRLRLSSEAEIGCSTHKGNVVLTVPKDDEERYFVDAEELWARWERPSSGFKIPVGEDASGDIVELDLANSNSPHLLIAGVTGGGKSEALLTILHGAAKFYTSEELRFRLIDPKQTELTTLAELPHTEGEIGVYGEDAIAMLEQALEEMEYRYQVFREAGQNIRNIAEYQKSCGKMARWLIVLDEYADLTSDDSERKQIEKYLQRLSQKARAAGIHVIVSTQKPVVKVINTVVKGNLPGKIALRVNTAMESRVILDETGAEKLVGKGDALIRCGNGILRTQFARYEV